MKRPAAKSHRTQRADEPAAPFPATCMLTAHTAMFAVDEASADAIRRAFLEGGANLGPRSNCRDDFRAWLTVRRRDLSG
jgi:hypothetical protein